MPASVDPFIDVCICTYQRASLAQTLASIDRQTGIENVRILVADNDSVPSARDLVETAGGRWPRVYLHAPARNISIARNALLAASRAPFIAWIDDDEVAEPGWLAALVAAIGDRDAAFGPVRAVYPSAAPSWIRKADLHSTKPVETVSGVVTGYTSNALVRRSAVGDARFSEALGRSGGEDTAFFTELHRLGRRYVAASDAIVNEPTEAGRLSLQWLSRRAFRSGQTHARTYIDSGRRMQGLVRASAKAAVCMAASGLLVWRPVARCKYWVRGALHRGVVARLLGADDLQLH